MSTAERKTLVFNWDLCFVFPLHKFLSKHLTKFSVNILLQSKTILILINNIVAVQ